ncbi:MAG TPA: BON domain-containing protein, partial [Terriglobales bacterium]|nr:BON domain-containing protein [Terriglobales bacterium]
IQQQIRTDSKWTTRPPVAGAREIPAEERAVAYHAEGREKAGFEQPESEPAQLIPTVQHVVPSGTSNSPHTIVRRRIPQGEGSIWRTATVLAVAAVLFLLLGASVHRLLPAPGGLALSSEVPQPQALFPRTNSTESLAATKPVEPTVVADRLPASVENSGAPQKRVVKPNSTYGSEGDLVAEENARVASEVHNRIRTDRRLQMTQVQVSASDGIVTLSGDVGSDVERVAAAQDAAQIGGVEVLLNKLRVINPNRKGPIVSSSISRSTIASSSTTSVTPSAVLPETHPTGSKAAGVSSISSPASRPAVDRPPRTPEQITVPYGTVLAVRLTETLSSGLNQPGDTFLASLVSPIVVGDRVVIPAGAGVKGRIVDARNARRFSGRATLVIEVTQLAYNGRTYELHSSQYSQQGASRNTYAAAAITGGAGVGAIIGTVIGKGEGAAIGAVLGAAAGTGVQGVTKRAPAQLSAESTLSFRLETPLTLQRVQSADPDVSQGIFSSNDRPVLKQRSTSQSPDTEPPRQPR